MNNKELNKLLKKLPGLKVGIIGDFCLDSYWQIDDSLSEVSVETGLRTRPVSEQQYYLGGAGNVAANVAAMGVENIAIFGVIGDDPFGSKMKEIAEELGFDTKGLLTQKNNWCTHTYIKPVENHKEAARIDFGNANNLDAVTADKVLIAIERAVASCDVMIINQQVKKGIHTRYFQKELNRIINSHRDKIFILDSRDISEAYPGCWHKMNDFEAARLCGFPYEPGDEVSRLDLNEIAVKLSEKWDNPFFITRGYKGCMVCEKGEVTLVPAVLQNGAIDTVGAGDSMLAGISVALAAKNSPQIAAELGNLTAGVSIQKIHQTGTASPAELRQLNENVNFVFNPDIALDIRSAVYHENSEIEIVEEFNRNIEIRHIVFDHDGTLSVLREGWEGVMEPMMIKAILGPKFSGADVNLYQKVQRRVKQFIDDSTGIQTLVQMQGLVKLVKEFGCVPDKDILDEHGYKEIYNDSLMELVSERLKKMERGELTGEDFAIKGAHEFLQYCFDRGIKLYLASGTDEEDVIIEAKAMGYADLFESRIYGAIGDVTKEAKRIVMDRILKDIGPQNVDQMLAIGDGPVEVREMRKRGGLAIGIASDELRKFGLNLQKRKRLIHAGAHLLISDYSQMQVLCELLNMNGGELCHTAS
ncbi:MAG: PfkB family carbohydrate kinase [Lentisphaeraceae bacterium]|nr:PfkB family carbohydrate kinase [Lentisphaeraceae bacterium]